jgi:hypothetical protein
VDINVLINTSKPEGAINNGQSRHWQYWAHKTQEKDKQKNNIENLKR